MLPPPSAARLPASVAGYSWPRRGAFERLRLEREALKRRAARKTVESLSPSRPAIEGAQCFSRFSMSSSPNDLGVAPTETGDGGEYPQSGRERMLMPQPIAVMGV